MQRQLSSSKLEQKAIASGMAERRLGAQRRLLASARPAIRHRLSQNHARHFMGRMRDGAPVRTFSLDDLKVDARDPANVRILFNREEKLPEGFREGQKVPRRQVGHVSDIFSAVRMLAHVSDSHADELASTNEALQVAERINAMLVVLVTKPFDRKVLATARQELDAMADIRRLASAYKRLAFEKLKSAEALLDAAGTTGNPLMVSAACAVLTAFRNRAGEWRTRQIARIDAYNELRECSLRMRRDRYMERLFAGYAKALSGPNTKKAFDGMVRDMVLCEELAKFGEQLPAGRGWREPARAHLHEIGKDIPEGRIKDSLREAYRMAKKASKEDFLSFMRGIARQLQVRDPCFIADELQKSGEKYLGWAISKLRMTIGHIHNQMPEMAAKGFGYAATRLR